MEQPFSTPKIQPQIAALSGSDRLLVGEHQKTRKTVIYGLKSRKIVWPAGAGLSP